MLLIIGFSIFSLTITLILSVWLLVHRFRKAGIRYLIPIPLFGNLFQSVFKRRHIGYLLNDVHNAFPYDKYVVFFQMTQPIILLKDPGIIRKVAVHDFESFSDRIGAVDEKQDPLLGKSLTFLKGEKWTQMKTKLSPSFKTRNLEQMIPKIEESTGRLIKHVSRCIFESQTRVLKGRTDAVDLRVLEIFENYFTDLVASLCFEVKHIDFYEHTPLHIFTKMLNKLSMSHGMFLRYLVSRYFLGLLRLMKLPFFNKKISKYFNSLMSDGIEKRKADNIHNMDFINHFIKMENECDRSYCTSQAVMFMLAGSDTMASTLAYLIHEITVQPNIQEMMRHEVQKMTELYGSNIKFDALNSLTYIDMVIKETLRKWPQTTAGLDRTCTKPTTLEPPREGEFKQFQVLPGDGIMISVITIHRDPKNWENPDKFDPERFNEINKQKIKPFTYMPFGIGPRTCIGKNLALTSLKIGLVHLLTNFQFARTERTIDEVDYDVNSFTLKPKELLIGIKMISLH